MTGSILLLLIYVICSALGLTLLKLGMNNGFIFSINAGIFEMKFHLLLIIGALLYILSFILNMSVMSKLNLSYFYPVSAGLIYITISIFSIFILKEKVSIMQYIGMFIILFGVVVMNLHKQ